MGQSSSVPKLSDATQVNNETPLDALQRAEEMDKYLEAISKSDINRRAREGNNYTPMNSSFSIVPAKDAQFPEGRIITMMPSADSGLPHTRGKDLICIPAYYPQERMEQLLLHERIHLHQKQHKAAYERFYKNYWDFKPNIYPLPESISRLLRLNPDTVGWPLYIWRDTWIPICLFQREDKPSLRECSYCWYNPKGGVLLKTMPPAWREFFGDVGQSEHPNELSACYGADFEKYNDVPAARVYYSFLFTREQFYSKSSERD